MWSAAISLYHVSRLPRDLLPSGVLLIDILLTYLHLVIGNSFQCGRCCTFDQSHRSVVYSKIIVHLKDTLRVASLGIKTVEIIVWSLFDSYRESRIFFHFLIFQLGWQGRVGVVNNISWILIMKLNKNLCIPENRILPVDFICWEQVQTRKAPKAFRKTSGLIQVVSGVTEGCSKKWISLEDQVH